MFLSFQGLEVVVAMQAESVADRSNVVIQQED